MEQKTSGLDYEIDLLKLFKIIWREKIKIILIVLISYGIGAYYVANNNQPPSYKISLDFKEGKRAEYLKFLRITNIVNKVPDIVKIYNTNKTFVKNSDSNFNLLNPDSIVDRFISEFMDYNEVIEVLNKNSSIQKELSQLSKEKQKAKLYNYAKLFSLNENLKEKSEFTKTYSIKFSWHDESEIIQILNDVIKVTLLNLEKSVYKELEDVYNAMKDMKNINDLKRIDYLLEQSSIAKSVNIKDNQIESIDIPNSNVMFNISTINANMPYYLRGYSAIDKEIELIKKRRYQELDILSSEISKLKKENTNWINYSIYLAEIKKTEKQNSIKILSLFVILGLTIGVLFVIILNELQSSKVVRK